MGLWDEQDQFYYDILNLPDGARVPLRVRSLVGLIPLCAVEVLDSEVFARYPAFAARAQWMLTHRPDLAALVSRWGGPGKNGRILLSLLRSHRSWRRSPACSMKRNFCPTTVCGPCRRPTLGHHLSWMPVACAWSSTMSRQVDDFAVRRKLELARPGVDADQLSACRGDP